MRTIILLAVLAALTLSAQTTQSSTGANSPNVANTKGDVKTEVAKTTPAPVGAVAPPELVFTEVQTLKIQLAATQIALLNKKYDIPSFQKEAQPFAQQQQAIYISGCKALGIPDSLIPTECGVEPGVDADGKAKVGNDGKPIPAKVWWMRPLPTQTAVTPGAGTK